MSLLDYPSLYDRFGGGDFAAYPMTDKDKRRLFRQGLLEFAANVSRPNGGNFANSLATGLLAAQNGMNEGAAQTLQNNYRLGFQPQDVRSFDYFANGLSPDDRAKAARIQLGLDPRAVTGAIKFDSFTGADGRERPARNNPTTGQKEIYYDESGQWVPLGGPTQPTAPQPSFIPSGDAQLPDGTSAYFDPSMPPEARAAAWNDATGNTGAPVMLPASAQPKPMQANTLPPPLDYQNGGTQRVPGLGVGRTAEEEAAAVERAKQQAQIDMAGGMGNAQATIEAAKQQGQDAAKSFDQLQQAGSAAIKEKARLSELRGLLKSTYTGPGANMALGLKRVASTLGIDVNGLGEAEAARALSNQLALSLRNPAGGEGMPGAMSDSDRAFLQQSVPSLNNTPEGWRSMIDMRLALADYAIKQAQYADQLRRNMTPIQDIPGKVQEWANAHPIFAEHGGKSNGPRPGAIENGYRFKGGNPADPNSWERI